MDNRGQFSIIAALFVAVILVSSVMVSYAAIRYSQTQDQPHILSAIDETNLALKQLLGFTVGYYGSVLQVTGNTSYARTLSASYLSSGLENVADIRPEWGSSFDVTGLELRANWFTNSSYSRGVMNVTYSLGGLGISNVAYSASCNLTVNIFEAQDDKACLNVTKDGEPLNNLGKQSFKFYRYRTANLTWEFATPETEPTSLADGTYLIDVPTQINPQSYVLQVEDTRGILVAASSYSHYVGTLTLNSTFVPGDYVDNCVSNVDNSTGKGTHSNFAAQQASPDGTYDTMTEGNVGAEPQDYHPDGAVPLGSTTLFSGSLDDLESDNGQYMRFRSYPSAFSGSSTFGYSTKGSSTSDFGYIRGSRFTTTSAGLATSISANMRFTSTSNYFGNGNSGSSGDSIENTIRGGRFTSPSSLVVTQNIRAYIYCSTSSKNMKAAIYTSSGSLVATTEQKSIAASGSASWQTFNFADPKPTLSPSTNYVLVVWSQSGDGSASLRYSSSSGGYGRYASQTYGSWPSSLSFSTNSYQYSIQCNYVTAFKAKVAIYSGTGGSLIASTDEKTIASTTDGWITFDFSSPPSLSASTQYVLVAWASDTANVDIYYDTGTARYFRQSATYPNWPSSVADQGSSRTYSIYCTYQNPTEFTCEVEFTGWSNSVDWNGLLWTIDSSSSVSGLDVTFQLYNYQTDQYPTSGDGYMTATLQTTDQKVNQTIAASPESFRDEIGGWKLKLTAVKSTSTQFEVNLDLVAFRPDGAIYTLDLEEQWTSVSYTAPVLCIKMGELDEKNLMVHAWHNETSPHWDTVCAQLVTGWNNISVASYVSGPTLTIRFRSENGTAQNSWQIDSALIRPSSNQTLWESLEDATATVEVLQNGTMRWFGQHLQLNTEAVPIPPIPVKAIHLSQTVDGVDQEVPFQIEDWASEYTVPLGMTNNATVFSNRQMIVFLMTPQVSEFTIWWNGSDEAVQTPLAYANSPFTYNSGARTLSNGRLTIQFASSGFHITSTRGATSSTADLMRINGEEDNTPPELSYVITNGVVRDVVHGEPEWHDGADNCPNLYASAVITLPADATYYTYQLRLMFVDSAQSRTITELCPIKLSGSFSTIKTENGTLLGEPVVAGNSGNFSDYEAGAPWTAHHWSQFVDGSEGAGIMFTDSANQLLYAFDAEAGGSTGAIGADIAGDTIKLLPVALRQVQFTYALDITWHGAVATFDDNSTPIYEMQGNMPTGLWILAELPPSVTVTTEN